MRKIKTLLAWLCLLVVGLVCFVAAFVSVVGNSARLVNFLSKNFYSVSYVALEVQQISLTLFGPLRFRAAGVHIYSDAKKTDKVLTLQEITVAARWGDLIGGLFGQPVFVEQVALDGLDFALVQDEKGIFLWELFRQPAKQKQSKGSVAVVVGKMDINQSQFLYHNQKIALGVKVEIAQIAAENWDLNRRNDLRWNTHILYFQGSIEEPSFAVRGNFDGTLGLNFASYIDQIQLFADVDLAGFQIYPVMETLPDAKLQLNFVNDFARGQYRFDKAKFTWQSTDLELRGLVDTASSRIVSSTVALQTDDWSDLLSLFRVKDLPSKLPSQLYSSVAYDSQENGVFVDWLSLHTPSGKHYLRGYLANLGQKDLNFALDWQAQIQNLKNESELIDFHLLQKAGKLDLHLTSSGSLANSQSQLQFVLFDDVQVLLDSTFRYTDKNWSFDYQLQLSSQNLSQNLAYFFDPPAGIETPVQVSLAGGFQSETGTLKQRQFSVAAYDHLLSGSFQLATGQSKQPLTGVLTLQPRQGAMLSAFFKNPNNLPWQTSGKFDFAGDDQQIAGSLSWQNTYSQSAFQSVAKNWWTTDFQVLLDGSLELQVPMSVLLQDKPFLDIALKNWPSRFAGEVQAELTTDKLTINRFFTQIDRTELLLDEFSLQWGQQKQLSANLRFAHLDSRTYLPDATATPSNQGATSSDQPASVALAQTPTTNTTPAPTNQTPTTNTAPAPIKQTPTANTAPAPINQTQNAFDFTPLKSWLARPVLPKFLANYVNQWQIDVSAVFVDWRYADYIVENMALRFANNPQQNAEQTDFAVRGTLNNLEFYNQVNLQNKDRSIGKIDGWLAVNPDYTTADPAPFQWDTTFAATKNRVYWQATTQGKQWQDWLLNLDLFVQAQGEQWDWNSSAGQSVDSAVAPLAPTTANNSTNATNSVAANFSGLLVIRHQNNQLTLQAKDLLLNQSDQLSLSLGSMDLFVKMDWQNLTKQFLIVEQAELNNLHLFLAVNEKKPQFAWSQFIASFYDALSYFLADPQYTVPKATPLPPYMPLVVRRIEINETEVFFSDLAEQSLQWLQMENLTAQNLQEGQTANLFGQFRWHNFRPPDNQQLRAGSADQPLEQPTAPKQNWPENSAAAAVTKFFQLPANTSLLALPTKQQQNLIAAFEPLFLTGRFEASAKLDRAQKKAAFSVVDSAFTGKIGQNIQAVLQATAEYNFSNSSVSLSQIFVQEQTAGITFNGNFALQNVTTHPVAKGDWHFKLADYAVVDPFAEKRQQPLANCPVEWKARFSQNGGVVALKSDIFTVGDQSGDFAVFAEGFSELEKQQLGLGFAESQTNSVGVLNQSVAEFNAAIAKKLWQNVLYIEFADLSTLLEQLLAVTPANKLERLFQNNQFALTLKHKKQPDNQEFSVHLQAFEDALHGVIQFYNNSRKTLVNIDISSFNFDTYGLSSDPKKSEQAAAEQAAAEQATAEQQTASDQVNFFDQSFFHVPIFDSSAFQAEEFLAKLQIGQMQRNDERINDISIVLGWSKGVFWLHEFSIGDPQQPVSKTTALLDSRLADVNQKPLLNFDHSFQNFPVARVSKFALGERLVDGDLRMTAQLSTQGVTLYQWLQNLNGAVNVQSSGLTLYNFPEIDLYSCYAIGSFRASIFDGQVGENSTVSSVSANLTVLDGRIWLDNQSQLSLPALSLEGVSGYINLVGLDSDFRVKMDLYGDPRFNGCSMPFFSPVYTVEAGCTGDLTTLVDQFDVCDLNNQDKALIVSSVVTSLINPLEWLRKIWHWVAD